MRRIFSVSVQLVLLALVSLALARPTAAIEQPFFQGSWRCQQGMKLSIGQSFGPWYVWQSNAANEARAFIRHTSSGSWVDVGADSSGGWWSATASGWQGNTLTFIGTYGNIGASQSLKQVFTRNSQSAFTIQTWHNGTLAGQVGCNR